MSGKKLKFFCRKMDDVEATVNYVRAVLLKGIVRGPIEIVMGREARTLDQNAKMWALLSDVQKHLPEWHGYKMGTEDYKHVIGATWKMQKFVPNAENTGFVVCGLSTRKLKKKEFCELVECIYYFAAENSVPLSEPSLVIYQDCKEYLEGLDGDD